MTMSKDRKELYEDMGPGDTKAVDNAFDAVIHSLVEAGINTEGDDRGENLVGAIARYIEDCRK